MTRGTYETGDIYVASALRNGGMKFIRVTKSGGKGIFQFEDSPEREKLVVGFYSGELTQNVRQYVNCWMSFKRLVENT